MLQLNNRNLDWALRSWLGRILLSEIPRPRRLVLLEFVACVLVAGRRVFGAFGHAVSLGLVGPRATVTVGMRAFGVDERVAELVGALTPLGLLIELRDIVNVPLNEILIAVLPALPRLGQPGHL